MTVIKPNCASLVASVFAIFAIGCGYDHVSGCSVGSLAATQTGNPNFSLVSTNPDLTIYPGETRQIAVQIQPVGNAQGSVTIASGPTADGISIAATTATIGSTVNLTVTAAPNIASQCFTGVQGLFTAVQPLTLVGTSAAGTVDTPIPLNVVLENDTFTPATTNLPVMSITTVAGAAVTSEDDYVDATLTITDPTHKSNNYTGTMGIKGHGNSTWLMPKKPYRLNLDSKAPLLGMTSDSNWILLANYDDKTMLRNDVSFKISNMVGMAWTPSTAFVEVYLNGAYQGTYQLSEKVEVSKARLNIGSLDDDDNSGTNLTGGYLGEIDNNFGEEDIFRSSIAGLPIAVADPDPPTDEQASYFYTAFTAAEKSMYTSNFTDPTTGWQASWDKDSVVNWFLVEELAGNEDADDWSSDYFYKPRGDALFYRGPVWDMDVTFGNVNYNPIQSPSVPWVATQSKWYVQLFKDPAFQAAVKTQWAAVRPQIITLPAYIDQRAAALNQAQQNNFARWPILGEMVWPNSEAAGTYQGEIDYLKNWLTQRIAYMDAHYLN